MTVILDSLRKSMYIIQKLEGFFVAVTLPEDKVPF